MYFNIHILYILLQRSSSQTILFFFLIIDHLKKLQSTYLLIREKTLRTTIDKFKTQNYINRVYL